MASIASGHKRKTFPALDAPDPEIEAKIPIPTSESEDSEDDSDAPEAITLTSERAVAAARSNAVLDHRKRLLEKKKARNKTREAFIQSTKSKPLKVSPTVQKPRAPVDEDLNDQVSDSDKDSAALAGPEGDSKLLARMEKAMQDALEDNEVEDDSSDEDDERQPTPSASSIRLPDSIFAAAALEHQKPEHKRKKSTRERENRPKRRRVRENPSEQVVGGRTVRIVNAINAPPPPPSRASRKITTSAKGGKAFRQKWKRRDGVSAQVRSRNGPAQKFASAA
ncbi:hypothetical protein FRC07_005239 [Ceratobasidium sp. 392]|nr:hypothetical protein FRC07_005239 [Ceratobasidium sp. 392]